MSGSTTEWIEQKVIESIAKYNSRIVFVDQLDFIVPMQGDDHSLRIGRTMRELKGIAKKWDITIVLICHLKKSQLEKQPNLDDLKGSSSIGQEADTVILLRNITTGVENNEEDEERRVWYVGATRAKEKLIITEAYLRGGKTTYLI